MATVMNSPHIHSTQGTRSSIQKVCLGTGIALVLMGFAGVVMPAMMGMHLSLTHNFIHLASGALAIWAATSDEPRKAYTFSISLGVLYGLLGLAGFVIGTQGYASVGNGSADQYLLRVLPNVLEFGSMDHSVHLLISAVFLFAAYWWKREETSVTKALVTTQARQWNGQGTIAPNSQNGLADADLGASDINRVTDVERRAEFESKL